jgi:hypothetical protein
MSKPAVVKLNPNIRRGRMVRVREPKGRSIVVPCFAHALAARVRSIRTLQPESFRLPSKYLPSTTQRTPSLLRRKEIDVPRVHAIVSNIKVANHPRSTYYVNLCP